MIALGLGSPAQLQLSQDGRREDENSAQHTAVAFFSLFVAHTHTKEWTIPFFLSFAGNCFVAEPERAKPLSGIQPRVFQRVHLLSHIPLSNDGSMFSQ